MNNETLGNRVRAKRAHCGISQEKLASLVGLSVRAINQIEVGILQKSFVADYLPLIAAELGTTEEILLKGELQSERMTREELQRMRKEGRVKSDEELEMVFGLATDTIRKRSNANIPLNRQELLNLIELIRGADGL